LGVTLSSPKTPRRCVCLCILKRDLCIFKRAVYNLWTGHRVRHCRLRRRRGVVHVYLSQKVTYMYSKEPCITCGRVVGRDIVVSAKTPWRCASISQKETYIYSKEPCKTCGRVIECDIVMSLWCCAYLYLPKRDLCILKRAVYNLWTRHRM